MQSSRRGSRPPVLCTGIPLLLLLLGAVGCASREWVQAQMTPLSGQLTAVETRLDQTEAEATAATRRLEAVEVRLGQNEAKTELALKNLEHLRLEQSFVLGVKEGINFPTASAGLSAAAQRAIDQFLRTVNGTHEAVFLVAGHTDSLGPEAYNYTLAQKRAATVAHYLIARRGIDPLRVTVVSYGKRMPLEDNATQRGRHKNRRVEILVYKEVITSAPGTQRLDLQRVSQQ